MQRWLTRASLDMVVVTCVAFFGGIGATLLGLRCSRANFTFARIAAAILRRGIGGDALVTLAANSDADGPHVPSAGTHTQPSGAEATVRPVVVERGLPAGPVQSAVVDERCVEEDLQVWLDSQGLHHVASGLARAGYDDLELLRELTDSETFELHSHVQMLPGHKVKLAKRLAKLRSACTETPAPASQVDGASNAGPNRAERPATGFVGNGSFVMVKAAGIAPSATVSTAAPATSAVLRAPMQDAHPGPEGDAAAICSSSGGGGTEIGGASGCSGGGAAAGSGACGASDVGDAVAMSQPRPASPPVPRLPFQGARRGGTAWCHVGARATISGFARRPYLNGISGNLGAYDAQFRLWEFEPDGTMGTLRVRVEHLKPCGAGRAPGSSPVPSVMFMQRMLAASRQETIEETERFYVHDVMERPASDRAAIDRWLEVRGLRSARLGARPGPPGPGARDVS